MTLVTLFFFCFCLITDVTTVKNLELLTNARDPASSHSLYGILNYTKTVGGGELVHHTTTKSI